MDKDDVIIAHRGASYDAPENTLSAINLAWEQGVMAVEVDVRLTDDNEVVVIHDADTKRISGQKRVIAKSTLNELKTMDVGSWMGAQWANERIPTLTEALATVPEGGKLIIEIKSDRRIIPHLANVLKQSGLQTSQIEIIAFDRRVLSELKRQLPEYRMLWLLDLDYSLPSWLVWISKRRLVRTVKESGLDGVNVWAGKVINSAFVNAFKVHNLLVYTWTVNDVVMANQLIDMGVDGITTDRPAWVIRQLKSGRI